MYLESKIITNAFYNKVFKTHLYDKISPNVYL